MRKSVFRYAKTKAQISCADQLRSNRVSDQHLCFCYIDSTIPLLPKSKILSFSPYSVIVQPGLCQTWSETPKTGFLATQLNQALQPQEVYS